MINKVSGGQSFLASIQNLLIFAIFKSSLNLNLIRRWSEIWCPGYLKHALSSSEIHLAAANSLKIIGRVTNCCKRPIVGCVWFIYRKMELRYWLVPGNVKKSRINQLNEKRSLIPWGLGVLIWKIIFFHSFAPFPCFLDAGNMRADRVSAWMNTNASRDQFAPKRIGENLAMNYNRS